MTCEEELNRDREPPHLMATEDHHRTRITAEQARQGRIVLQRLWQRLLVLFVLPVAVLAIVLLGLAIGV